MHYKQLILPLAAVAHGAAQPANTASQAIIGFMHSRFFGTVAGYAVGAYAVKQYYNYQARKQCDTSDSFAKDISKAMRAAMDSNPDTEDHTITVEGREGTYTMTWKSPKDEV